jgi:uncharacterized protein (TIGR03790 family)
MPTSEHVLPQPDPEVRMTHHRFMIIPCAFVVAFMTCSPACRAVTSYNDVLVLVNANSTLSVNVANYFRAQRGIPGQNICSISMPLTEQIDDAGFVSICVSIKNYLTANGLTSTINYIVTTQGVPLKVRRLGSVFSSTSTSSSFDSEIGLLNSGMESSIAGAGPASNPYGYANTHFSRSTAFNNIYLVTRLAGYCYADITGLIDRAVQPYHSGGRFVFDGDPAHNLSSSLNQQLDVARDLLQSRGFTVLHDKTSLFLTDQTDVLGYVSFGSNDPSWSLYSWKAQPRMQWSAKALAETFVSSSGRSFCDSTFIEPTIGWQSLVADLIHENGVTGVKGYVFEPYSSAMAKPSVLFDRWTNGYNLAESYSAASSFVSWMDVIVGDPKSLFAADGHLPVQLIAFSGCYRNATVALTWKTATEMNNAGFEVQRRRGQEWTLLGFVPGCGTANIEHSYSFTDNAPGSENLYRLKQIDRDGTSSYSPELAVLATRESVPTAIHPNYPNPVIAGGETVCSFTLSAPSTVRVVLYDANGRVVETVMGASPLDRGTHMTRVSTLGLRPGIYHIMVQGEGWSIGNRIVVG